MEKSLKELSYFIRPGNLFVCWEPYKLATVLGSCVAVCLFDARTKVAGMGVFAFPKIKNDSNHTFYGNYSIPKLLEMMYNLGAQRDSIRAHIVGGSYSKQYLTKDFGNKNVEIAEKYLKKNKILVVNNDTRGSFGRKVLFDTYCGEIIVYKSNNIREKDWYDHKSFNNR